jgi:hypothetical protein
MGKRAVTVILVLDRLILSPPMIAIGYYVLFLFQVYEMFSLLEVTSTDRSGETKARSSPATSAAHGHDDRTLFVQGATSKD